MSNFNFSSAIFWICIFSGVTGLFSSSFIYIATTKDSLIFPNITQILNWKFSRKPFIVFETVANVSLYFIAFYTMKFFAKAPKGKSRDSRRQMKFLYPCHIIVTLALPLSHTCILLFRPLIYPRFHNAALFIFVASLILFHVITDLFYAASTDSIIKYAWYTDILCAIGWVIAFFLQIIDHNFESNYCFIFQNLFIFFLITSGFLKLIFTGIFVLGARFVTSTAGLFKKEKQTIFADNYYQA